MKLLKFIRIVAGLLIFGLGLAAQIEIGRSKTLVDMDGGLYVMAGMVIPCPLWIAIMVTTMFCGLMLAIGKSDAAIAH